MKVINDPLWQLAKKRVAFKKHFWSYLLLNTFLWGVWLLSFTQLEKHAITPSPIWITFFWGIGLLFSYVEAYATPSHASVENEFKKLKNNF